MLVPPDEVITQRERYVLQATIVLSGSLSLREHADQAGISYDQLQKSLSGKQTPGPRLAEHLSTLLHQKNMVERYRHASMRGET